MKSFTCEGINEFLVGMSRVLLHEGIYRDTPGFQKENSNRCVELPYPAVIEINNPSAREVKIPERKWNRTLSYAESLWLLLGWNNLDDLPGRYVKNTYNFSDNGRTWRAGYSPRIRFYDGSKEQYDIGMHGNNNIFLKKDDTVDQLKYVYEVLKKDINSRQALMTIHDPIKDSQIDLVTKDQPCTRSIQFMVVKGKLNCYVTMRSNDLLWGASAVNIFNFTFMQEYMSKLLGIPIGKYYHIAHNFHFYEDFLDRIIDFNNFEISTAKEFDQSFQPNTQKIESYEELLKRAEEIKRIEEWAYKTKNKEKVLEEIYKTKLQEDDFFLDWAMIFVKKNLSKSDYEYIKEQI